MKNHGLQCSTLFIRPTSRWSAQCETLSVLLPIKLGTHLDLEGMKGWVHLAQSGVKLGTCSMADRCADHQRHWASHFILTLLKL